MKYFCPVCGKATNYSLHPPKFCCECAAPFGSRAVSKKSPAQTPAQDKSEYDKSIEREKLEIKKSENSENRSKFSPDPLPPKIKNFNANIDFSSGSTSIEDDRDDDGYADDEDDDYYSRSPRIGPNAFTNIKPKFTVQSSAPQSQSFENIVTQSYASNYKPLDSTQLHQGTINAPQQSVEQVLEEFKREASASRQNN
jgi:hypothetical protein